MLNWSTSAIWRHALGDIKNADGILPTMKVILGCIAYVSGSVDDTVLYT